MCCRYLQNPRDDLAEIRRMLEHKFVRIESGDFDAPDAFPDSPQERFPAQICSVILLHKGVLRLLPALWGFKKWDGKGVVANARSETVYTSRFFAESAEKYHCAVPARCFYEWSKPEGENTSAVKYGFRSDINEIYMAGIYRRGECGGEFAVLTKPAGEFAQIHPRTTCLIEPDRLPAWLGCETGADDLGTVKLYAFGQGADVDKTSLQ
ncbi:hypothetical protein SDC9_94374 [bioreactor metagenome]|uniref:SOS response-associated peptidase YedK n=1 Tax=bioreactor metagenome TaxID=1076179 RepID=A0A645A3N9_9ZZZZ|nr:SOS response-associated peptidase family protein [Oscillospiraceae bacterium]